MTDFIHLAHGSFFADIIRDAFDPNLWLYVVQRQGSCDVLAMGSCAGEQPARDMAAKIMHDLATGSATAAR